MKKYIFSIALLFTTVNMYAQSIPKSSTLPPQKAPGYVAALRPDLTVTCSNVQLYSYGKQTSYGGIVGEQCFTFLSLTITVRNDGDGPSTKPFDVRGYYKNNNYDYPNTSVPLFIEFNDSTSTDRTWKFAGCQLSSPCITSPPPCMFSFNDTIMRGASVTRQCIIDLGGTRYKIGYGNTFFFTLLVDYTKKISETREDNNVMNPITIRNIMR